MKNHEILITQPQKHYELLDSGEGEKLERFGEFVVARPDPQALWPKELPAIWKKAEAVFSEAWQLSPDLPAKWPIEFGGLRFIIRPSTFKHVGIFPEQLSNWEWLREVIKKANRPVEVLNLFGYTGGATLACAEQPGASVVHVDGSKVAIGWARENAELSGLQDKPVRWLLDDAVAFLKREVRRERGYDIIILDPPAFGHGPKGEVWKIEKNMLELLELCLKTLSKKPLAFLINGYAAGYSPIAYKNNLEKMFTRLGGEVTFGELAIAHKNDQRLLPAGIFARWQA